MKLTQLTWKSCKDLAGNFSLIAVVATLLLTQGCNLFRPSWISDASYEVSKVDEISLEDFDGPLGGHFDDDGNWSPDDQTIEWTYQIPDISAGFVFDVRSLDVSPSIQVEILEFDIPLIRYLRTWKFDLGVAYQRVYAYLGPRITSIFEISIGGFCGWNWEENELSYGIGFTIIKF